jgi:methionine aminotransferase
MVTPKFSGTDSTILENLSAIGQASEALNLACSWSGLPFPQEFTSHVIKYTSTLLNEPVPAMGARELRETVVQKYLKRYNRLYDVENEVMITTGVTQAIYAAIAALVREGDQVMVFEPCDCRYTAAVELNGGEVVYIKLKDPDFQIDWENVQKMVSNRTRMIIMGSPHNPTGWAMTEIDMIRLQRMISGTRIVVVADETFEHMVFDGEAHQSLSAFPKLAEQGIVVSSYSESFNIKGWSLACSIAPASIMREIRKIQQMIQTGVSYPLQIAMSDWVEKNDDLHLLKKLYQDKRDLFIGLMENSKFQIVPSKGSYFQVIGFSAISKLSDKEFAAELAEKHGVVLAPMSLFYHEKNKLQYLRVNLAQPDDIIREVAARLCKV